MPRLLQAILLPTTRPEVGYNLDEVTWPLTSMQDPALSTQPHSVALTYMGHHMCAWVCWLQGMIKASAYTAWGLFCTAAEQAEIAEPLGEGLLSVPWGPDLRKHAAGNAICPGMAMFAPNGLRLPRFISWIMPFRWGHIFLLLPCFFWCFPLSECRVPSCFCFGLNYKPAFTLHSGASGLCSVYCKCHCLYARLLLIAPRQKHFAQCFSLGNYL